MIAGEVTCPRCGTATVRKDGLDRRGAQVYRCRNCRRCFTALSATPFSGYRFPPDVIALAVRWYLRYRLSDADVAELLAERGVRVDPSTIYAWVQEFAPLYEDSAPLPPRCREYLERRRDLHKGRGQAGLRLPRHRWTGQVIDVYVSTGRATENAITFFRRAIEATGVVPDDVTTDRAASYPPALAAVLPGVLHETGKAVQQRIERDHQHLKGRLRPTRGCKTLAGARLVCRAHAFLRNLRGQFYDLGQPDDVATTLPLPPTVRAWDALTTRLLGD